MIRQLPSFYLNLDEFFFFQKSRVVILDHYLEDCNQSSENNFSVSAVTKGSNTSARTTSQEFYFQEDNINFS